MPEKLQKIAAAATENEQIAGMRVAAKPFLDQQRQAVHPGAHVGDATGQPDPHRRRDHRSSRTAGTRANASVKLVAEYYWSPDLLAPAPGGRRWRPEDWYRTAIAGDPVRNAVAGVIARWGEAWQPRIAAAFSAGH